MHLYKNIKTKLTYFERGELKHLSIPYLRPYFALNFYIFIHNSMKNGLALIAK